jgi:hypothetical protein
MTKEEARNVLALPRKHTPRDIEAAYARLYPRYVSRLSYATRPSERDVASNAAGLLQEAYRVLTGRPPPTLVMLPAATARIATPDIPRASLAGRRSGQATAQAARQPATRRKPVARTTSSVHTPTRPGLSGGWRERVVGAFIYSAICLVALLVMFKGAGCTR